MSAGTREPDGIWSLTERYLHEMVLMPHEKTPSRINLKVTAFAVEATNDATSTQSAVVELGIVAAAPAPPVVEAQAYDKGH